MEKLCFLGEPALKPDIKKSFIAPASQAKLCFEVIKETQDKKIVLDKLRQEYVAIVIGLLKMGIDFRIIYAHPKEADEGLISFCNKELNCKVSGFPSRLAPCFSGFPRDLAVTLPGFVLMNPVAGKFFRKEKENFLIFPSYYGEGGRVLSFDSTALMSERIVTKEGRPSLKARKPTELCRAGIKIGFFPSSVSVKYTSEKDVSVAGLNDHIDRVACLLKGKDKKLHLLVDPKILIFDWKNPEKGKNGKIFYKLLSAEKTKEMIDNLGKKMGLQVHYPEKLQVPCSLNLLQFSDNRVLMTDGDKSLASLVSDIVGQENIFKTEIPIRYFPAWRYGGIRCLINEFPDLMFRSITSAK